MCLPTQCDIDSANLVRSLSFRIIRTLRGILRSSSNSIGISPSLCITAFLIASSSASDSGKESSKLPERLNPKLVVSGWSSSALRLARPYDFSVPD